MYVNHMVELPAYHLAVGVQVWSCVLSPLVPEPLFRVFERKSANQDETILSMLEP
jgi:hypothetical protein